MQRVRYALQQLHIRGQAAATASCQQCYRLTQKYWRMCLVWVYIQFQGFCQSIYMTSLIKWERLNQTQHKFKCDICLKCDQQRRNMWHPTQSCDVQ